jgi:post-segregation antitoxin (ccd killing protein)
MSASTKHKPDPQKTITVTLDAAALGRLEAAGQNPQRLAERALRLAATRLEPAKSWEAENLNAIERYNARIERSGLLNDRLRRF